MPYVPGLVFFSFLGSVPMFRLIRRYLADALTDRAAEPRRLHQRVHELENGRHEIFEADDFTCKQVGFVKIKEKIWR